MVDKGKHHHHIRKRIYKKHEPYPHPNKVKRFVDKLIYPVAIMGPVMTIPQFINVWIGKDASGVSALSWFSYSVLSIVWLIYGLLHKEKPIIITSIIWIILDALIAIGALIY